MLELTHEKIKRIALQATAPFVSLSQKGPLFYGILQSQTKNIPERWSNIAPKCRYFDYCPISVNRDNYHVYGRTAVEMFFHNKFTFRILSVSDAVIEDENSANFLVAYGGTCLYARATIERYTEDSLIQELTVRPA